MLKWNRLVGLLLAGMLFVCLAPACSDSDDNEGTSGTDVLEDMGSQEPSDVAEPEDLPSPDVAAEPDEQEPTPDLPVAADLPPDVPEEEVSAPQAGTVVSFSIHNDAGAQCLDLTEMTAKDDTSAGYDILVTKSSIGPIILLGADTTALNLGNECTFDEADEVPHDGYLPDSGEDYAIGLTWRDGGAGETGFNMTNNVYALHRADGTYAKMMVVSAVAGTIEIIFFYQPDGSTNVATDASFE